MSGKRFNDYEETPPEGWEQVGGDRIRAADGTSIEADDPWSIVFRVSDDSGWSGIVRVECDVSEGCEPDLAHVIRAALEAYRDPETGMSGVEMLRFSIQPLADDSFWGAAGPEREKEVAAALRRLLNTEGDTP